mgnify:CR=1 FL=1
MPKLTTRQKILHEDCDFILQKSPVDWQLLRNSNILLTGGTGYYGKWFLASFLHINKTLQLHANLYVVSRSPENFFKNYTVFQEHKDLTFIKGDVRTFSFPKGEFNYVIHAATEVATTQERDAPEEMLSVSEHGTKHVLDFAKEAGVKKLLLTSSGAIYGPQPPELEFMPETYKGKPTTVYGKAKKISEDMCLASDVNCSIARCYASVGPWLRLDAQYAIGNFILNVLKNEPIIIKSDGRPYRSYLYTADLISWLWTILINGKTGEPYNVGSEHAVSILELAQITLYSINKNLSVKVLGIPNLSVPAPRYVPSTYKAHQELLLNQSRTLTESISRTIQQLM